MPDQVPAEREIRGFVHLRERFLDLVFAEVDLTRAGGGAHMVSGKGFGDGDEADGARIASGAAGGPRDARADLGQPVLKGYGIEHYFLIVARIDFAVAAFGPLGASFM